MNPEQCVDDRFKGGSLIDGRNVDSSAMQGKQPDTLIVVSAQVLSRLLFPRSGPLWHRSGQAH